MVNPTSTDSPAVAAGSSSSDATAHPPADAGEADAATTSASRLATDQSHENERMMVPKVAHARPTPPGRFRFRSAPSWRSTPPGGRTPVPLRRSAKPSTRVITSPRCHSKVLPAMRSNTGSTGRRLVSDLVRRAGDPQSGCSVDVDLVDLIRRLHRLGDHPWTQRPADRGDEDLSPVDLDHPTLAGPGQVERHGRGRPGHARDRPPPSRPSSPNQRATARRESGISATPTRITSTAAATANHRCALLRGSVSIRPSTDSASSASSKSSASPSATQAFGQVIEVNHRSALRRRSGSVRAGVAAAPAPLGRARLRRCRAACPGLRRSRPRSARRRTGTPALRDRGSGRRRSAAASASCSSLTLGGLVGRLGRSQVQSRHGGRRDGCRRTRPRTWFLAWLATIRNIHDRTDPVPRYDAEVAVDVHHRVLHDVLRFRRRPADHGRHRATLRTGGAARVGRRPPGRVTASARQQRERHRSSASSAGRIRDRSLVSLRHRRDPTRSRRLTCESAVAPFHPPVSIKSGPSRLRIV